MATTISERLARHFAALDYEGIPPGNVADAKRLVLDYLGVAIAGSQTESGRIAREFAVRTGGVPEATLIPGGPRVPALHAAFANAVASHSIELDDVDARALFHFSPPVVSAALATAERVTASGREFIAAVVAGCEMMARLSEAMNPALRDRGFHTTPTCGVFGAAIAAGRLLRLDAAGLVSALGLAGAQASGLMEMYGPSMQKRFNPGPAARNGVAAALMAEMGFTGAATIFDGERGFCRAFGEGADLERLTRGLGIEFPIFIEFKPYACARPIHNAIDCALAIRRQHNPPLGSIRGIVVERHPAWAHYHANPRPATYHEAQVSLPYSVAVALAEGAALLPQYTDQKLADPAIGRLAELVRIVVDPSLPRGVSCRLSLEMADGRVLTAQVDHPKGSIENPMTADEISVKVHQLADGVIGGPQVARLIETASRLGELKEIGELVRVASPGGVSEGGALRPGLTSVLEWVVTEALCTVRGGRNVFSTPSMVFLVERAAVQLLEPLLGPGQSSVGTRVDVRHLAPTLLGMTVRAEATLTHIEGRRVTFRVKVFEEDEQVGEADHERAIIDIDRYRARLDRKSPSPPAPNAP